MQIHTLWVGVGLFGQVCFFSRSLWQWLASEKAGRSIVPRAFWQLSMLGALCVLAYALYRQDPVFVLGMLPSTCIYVRNLFLNGEVTPKRKLAPVALAFLAFIVWAVVSQPTVDNKVWATLGLTGSAIWSSRFVVQWWVSERRGAPTLPAIFWVMSLLGNVLMLAYSIYKRDPVFIPGQSIGFIVYLRNLYLIRKAKP